MGKDESYNDAQDAQTEAIENYTKVLEEGRAQAQDAYNRSQQYVGDAGYQRALEAGQEGAVQSTGGAIAGSTGGARSAGMNMAQAAAIGANTGLNAYNDNLQQQQSNAYTSGMDAVGTEQSLVNAEQARSSGYGNVAGLTAQDASAKQAELQNDRGFFGNVASGIAGGVGNLFSDERVKEYKTVQEYLDDKPLSQIAKEAKERLK